VKQNPRRPSAGRQAAAPRRPPHGPPGAAARTRNRASPVDLDRAAQAALPLPCRLHPGHAAVVLATVVSWDYENTWDRR